MTRRKCQMVKLRPIKRKFEDAVIRALGTLPQGAYQRVDGLVCESVVLATYPVRFMRIRLWLMEKRGVIESYRFHQFWPSCQGMKSYRLPQ